MTSEQINGIFDRCKEMEQILAEIKALVQFQKPIKRKYKARKRKPMQSVSIPTDATLLTLSETASVLTVSSFRIRELIKSGDLTVVNLGERSTRVTVESINSLLNSNGGKV